MNPWQAYLDALSAQTQQNQFNLARQNQNLLPKQEVLQANGKASIDALQMAPNSSVLIMDKTAPIIWLCVSDGLGNVTSTPYDIAPHQETPPVDVNALETRIASIETVIAQLQEGIGNAKSNDGGTKSKQSSGNVGKSVTDKTGMGKFSINGEPADTD